MTKKSVKAEINTFIKGLVTEASPLNFPENASLDEENFELLRTGVRKRRLGLDYEDGYALLGGYLEESFKNYSVSTFVWKDVAGVAGKDFLVVQIDNRFLFFDTGVSLLSSVGYIESITTPPSFSTGKKHTFASVDGNLIVANGSYEILSVSYDSNAGLFVNPFSQDFYTLKVRDLWGVQDDATDADIYFQPTTLNDNHQYNLYNQGWAAPRRAFTSGDNIPVYRSPVSWYFDAFGKYPAASEVMWTSYSMFPGTDPHEFMRSAAWKEVFGSAPRAARGYFVIDALKRGPSRTKAIEDNKARFPDEVSFNTFPTNSDTTPGGASIVHEFAGRVFYAGFSGEVVDPDLNSPNLSSYILFSKLVNSKADLGKCYQEGDPTSRENNDIVDTDGGFIRISGASNILKLENIGSSLIVIASNGVWSVTGGSDYGFSATNYKVTNLSDYGGVSPSSVVKVGESIFFWGENAIYSIGKSQMGDLTVSSTTDQTIQQFYAKISFVEKENSIGVYDDVSKTVRWIYFTSTDVAAQPYIKELVLDTRIPAFYVYKVNNLSKTCIRGVFSTRSTSSSLSNENIFADVDAVFVESDDVVIPASQGTVSDSTVKYLMFNSGPSKNTRFTFGSYKNELFRDWYSQDGVGLDAKAYLLTGAIIAGDSSVAKQSPYVTVHMMRTEEGVDAEYIPLKPSGCFMRSQWEWSNSPNSNKWGQAQQVYRYRRGYMAAGGDDPFDTGFEMVTTKNKLRGRGRAMSLYFETEPSKDCQLVGWNINVNGNAVT